MTKPAGASRRANRRADPSATRTLADPNGGIAGPDEIAASQVRQARADGERGHAPSVAHSRRGRVRESADRNRAMVWLLARLSARVDTLSATDQRQSV
jgi:hypothetical protein